MNDSTGQPDPSAPLPSHHRRAVGAGQVGARNPGAQPGGEPRQTSLPVRWTRQSASGQNWPLFGRIHRVYHGRMHRRWIVASLLVAVVVLTALGLGTSWFWMISHANVAGNSNTTMAGSRESHDGEPNTDDVIPEMDPARPTTVDLSALKQMILPALVTIYQGSGHGTGFLIEGKLVVTAYHVVSPSQGLRASVVFQDQEQAHVVEHVVFDAVRDLAVLRTDTRKERPSLKLASSLPAVGAHVAAFKPGGGEIQGTVTAIGKTRIPGEAAECEMLQTTLNAVPGWSGGPVVNMEGEVVGINKRLDGSLFETQGLRIATGSAAVPVTVLQPLLTIVRLTDEIRSDPNNADHRRDRASLYSSIHDYAKAIDDYNKVIQLEPDDADAYCRRGKAYVERGEYAKAITDFSEAIALNGESIEAYRGRAAAREKNGDRDGAITDHLELLHLVPKDEADVLEAKLVEMYKNRAKSRAAVREVDNAIADLGAAIDLRPNDVESRQQRALLYEAKGESDQAIADYTEAIRSEPKRAELYRRRGLVIAANGDHDKAIDDFTEAIRLNPKDAEAYCARGAVHGGRHDFKKAIADFTEAIRIDDGFAKAYFDRGSAYKAQGDEAKAQKDFGRAMDRRYRPER